MASYMLHITRYNNRRKWNKEPWISLSAMNRFALWMSAQSLQLPVCVASIHFKALRGFISMKAVLQQRCGGSSSQKEHSNRYESSAAVSVWAHAAWWKRSKNSHYHLKELLKITCVRGREQQRQKGREKVKTLCLNNPRYLQQTRLDPNISHRWGTDTLEACSIKIIGDYSL